MGAEVRRAVGLVCALRPHMGRRSEGDSPSTDAATVFGGNAVSTTEAPPAAHSEGSAARGGGAYAAAAAPSGAP